MLKKRENDELVEEIYQGMDFPTEILVQDAVSWLWKDDDRFCQH